MVHNLVNSETTNNWSKTYYAAWEFQNGKPPGVGVDQCFGPGSLPAPPVVAVGSVAGDVVLIVFKCELVDLLNKLRNTLSEI